MRLSRMMVLALLLALGACLRMPPVPDMRTAIRSPSLTGAAPRSVTLPFILDAGRVLVEITLLKPGGGERNVLAFVNMGSGSFGLSHALFRELNPGNGRPLRLKFGAMQIALDGRTIQPLALASGLHLTLNPLGAPPSAADMAKEKEPNADFFAPRKIEAVIPPGLLQHFQVVFDYGARHMTLAVPGTLAPEGVAVPIRVNPRTGFATVDATLDGMRTPLVIDNGGGFSALRDVAPVIDAHPSWLRSQGGIGWANYLFAPGGADALSPVIKIPGAALGPLKLPELGAQEPRMPALIYFLAKGAFWDWYGEKAGEEIQGWIGGNVLKNFRVTLDYPARTSHWLAQGPFDTHDLDQVGIVLGRAKDVVTIIGIALKNGAPTVSDVKVGDRLLKIGDLETSGATRDQMLSALHGKPSENKRLTLERGGKRIELDVPVTGF
ncbi:hypothetical protein AYO42_00190 [Rhizomicrobium sp. SCGC AG-212-E05]|nr:hypothetical protein AYO42_00190 [Rhizomicrobium sp. SCGC AG-212-E05]